MYKNKMNLKFSSLSVNESFARLAVASFCANENLNVEEISDIKTAVSEAVTNSIVHGYVDKVGEIEIDCSIYDDYIEIIIKDKGIGIADVKKAMMPFYTTKPDVERSGMGFTVMEGFMDKLEVISKEGEGTTVKFIKNIHNK